MGIFTFRAFLNIGMLVTDSENTRELRSIVLNITLDTINKKAGGSTKYINQREENFLTSSFHEENTRDTFYSEVLDMVSAHENGLASAIEQKHKILGKKLNSSDVNQIFKEFITLTESAFLPLLTKCRQKIASRDLCFRDVLHQELKDYIGEVSAEDFLF